MISITSPLISYSLPLKDDMTVMTQVIKVLNLSIQADNKPETGRKMKENDEDADGPGEESVSTLMFPKAE